MGIIITLEIIGILVTSFLLLGCLAYRKIARAFDDGFDSIFEELEKYK